MVDERQDQPTAPKAEKQSSDPSSSDTSVPPTDRKVTDAVKEIGGQKGPEPTRYGDWEKGGRCTDF